MTELRLVQPTLEGMKLDKLEGREGWYIAVDGGGTKIAVAALKGSADTSASSIDFAQALTWHREGTGSAHPATWSTAARNLCDALQAALDHVGHDAPIHCIYLALAGAGRVEDQQRVVEFIRRSLGDERLRTTKIVCSGDIDPILYLPGGVPGRSTIAVILGTGSVVAALDEQGSMIRAGGWGPMLGDQCSAGAIGLSALQLVAQAIDAGQQSKTASPLVRAITDHLQNDALENKPIVAGSATPPAPLNNLIIQTAADRTRRARLSLVVVQWAYQQKDRQALETLQPHIDALAWQIGTVAERLRSHANGIELRFSGGLADRCPELLQAIVQQCRQNGHAIDHCSVVQPLRAALHRALAG